MQKLWSMLIANNISIYLVDRLKGKAPACIHEVFELIKILGSKVISLCRIFFPAPDYEPPHNNSASMNTIRF